MPTPPQNLLFLLSDQHNRDTLGCYGHPLVRTPNLDRLSSRGVRFTGAYCNCPISVPSRASLATGRYVHQIGNWDNAVPYDGRVPSWGHRLIKQGHEVVAIGKLHYRDAQNDDGFSAKEIPLNVVDGVGDLMGALRDPPPRRASMRDGVLTAGPGDSTYLQYDRQIADRARQWLQRQASQPSAKPWVLFVSFVCPHPPFIAPPALYDSYPQSQMPLPVQFFPSEQPKHPALQTLRHTLEYDATFTEKQLRNVTAAYYGMCTHLDEQVGKVLAVLEQTGLSRSTRVMYTSDHGECMGRRGLWGKCTHYEESAAVPFLMAGPDVAEGQTCDTLISLVDCFPTILESVGVELTAQDRDLPGESLWSIMRGEPKQRTVLSEYHAVGSTDASYMLRDGPYKYIHHVNAPAQLFDIDQDPQELNDLAQDAEHHDTLSAMHQKLCALLDPQAVDTQAKSDQRALIERHGGRDAIMKRGSFVNSPAPGETPRFVKVGG